MLTCHLGIKLCLHHKQNIRVTMSYYKLSSKYNETNILNIACSHIQYIWVDTNCPHCQTYYEWKLYVNDYN